MCCNLLSFVVGKIGMFLNQNAFSRLEVLTLRSESYNQQLDYSTRAKAHGSNPTMSSIIRGATT